MSNSIHWVMVKLIGAAMLIGLHWRETGDEFALPFDRAKTLAKRKQVEFIGEPQAGPMPDESVKKSANKKTKQSDDKPSADGETFDDIGIAAATATLLIAGGITSPAELRQAIAAGDDLTALDGIGKATAASIVAQLNRIVDR